ncbi:hypothetical protein M569_06904 [Genlisea aurea]|uniref:HSF-type DNA-binding domain-containing protein n=1 Tax=Genlisea aurea TaxID=192259 RepID=S8DX83_9LAMI|nr:hypothetical protein M569_06904 [Genlisea aurea]
MHEAVEVSSGSGSIVAPFVMKTYQMVDDQSTDELITWGRANNSFIVLEPLDFSRTILPAYFKHHNFSSFVRQLNTYGFRKVDPDRWEFANEWFLRGKAQVLCNIVRRKHTPKSVSLHGDEDRDELLMEIAKLKKEQRNLELELEKMNRRLEITERKPQQMMNLLCKIVEDPDFFLPKRMKKLTESSEISEKKRKLMLCCSIKSEDEEEHEHNHPIPLISESTPASSSPDMEFDAYCCQSSTSLEMSSPESLSHRQSASVQGGYDNNNNNNHNGNYCCEGLVAMRENESPPIPYPFSLLGGGF